MNEKLKVLVSVDLDCARARVAAQGHVTVRSVQALYVVVKRANSLMRGLTLEVDMAGAWVDPDALAQLRACSKSRQLPVRIDPSRAECRISIVNPGTTGPVASDLLLAA